MGRSLQTASTTSVGQSVAVFGLASCPEPASVRAILVNSREATLQQASPYKLRPYWLPLPRLRFANTSSGSSFAKFRWYPTTLTQAHSASARPLSLIPIELRDWFGEVAIGAALFSQVAFSQSPQSGWVGCSFGAACCSLAIVAAAAIAAAITAMWKQILTLYGAALRALTEWLGRLILHADAPRYRCAAPPEFAPRGGFRCSDFTSLGRVICPS